MKKRKVILKNFEYKTEPQIVPRTPYYYMDEEELRSITDYPYLVKERCAFEFTVEIDNKDYTFSGVIPNGFLYNVADIPWFVEPITYDKHSPFVKNASLIHDFLLARKRVLYEDWKLKELGITPVEFKEITSLVFCHVLKYNAVPYGKAQIMSFFVNLWQTTIVDWYNIDKTETQL